MLLQTSMRWQYYVFCMTSLYFDNSPISVCLSFVFRQKAISLISVPTAVNVSSPFSIMFDHLGICASKNTFYTRWDSKPCIEKHCEQPQWEDGTQGTEQVVLFRSGNEREESLTEHLRISSCEEVLWEPAITQGSLSEAHHKFGIASFLPQAWTPLGTSILIPCTICETFHVT